MAGSCVPCPALPTHLGRCTWPLPTHCTAPGSGRRTLQRKGEGEGEGGGQHRYVRGAHHAKPHHQRFAACHSSIQQSRPSPQCERQAACETAEAEVELLGACAHTICLPSRQKGGDPWVTPGAVRTCFSPLWPVAGASADTSRAASRAATAALHAVLDPCREAISVRRWCRPQGAGFEDSVWRLRACGAYSVAVKRAVSSCKCKCRTGALHCVDKAGTPCPG